MVLSLELGVKGNATPGKVRPPAIDGATYHQQSRMASLVKLDEMSRVGNFREYGNGVVTGYCDPHRYGFFSEFSCFSLVYV